MEKLNETERKIAEQRRDQLGKKINEGAIKIEGIPEDNFSDIDLYNLCFLNKLLDGAESQ